MLGRVVFVGCLFLSACQTPQINQLPTYEAAHTLAPADDTRCFYADSVDLTQFPQLIPFATSDWQYASDKVPAVRAVLKKAKVEARPDVIVFVERGKFYAGSVGTASAVPLSGGGAVATGFSSPIYQNALTAVFYRLAPCALGIRWDESGMVMSVSDVARTSGMLEGDHIISIDDAPVVLGPRFLESSHYSKILAHHPGEEVKLVWIRPGTGRMDGKLKLQENPPIHLTLPAVDVRPPPRAVE